MEKGGNGRRNVLAGEPVADVVCVAIIERHTDTRVQQHFQIFDEIGVDKVAG